MRSRAGPPPATARRQRGLAAVEFSIVGLVLVLLLVVAADYGRIFATSIAVTNAARAGAQYGIQSASTWANTAGMQAAALADGNEVDGLTATATNFCECTAGTAVSCITPGCSSPRRYVSVTASATFAPLTALPGLPGSVTLTRTAIMRAP
jgi:Flp pilus assembly protein TadG